MTTAQALNKSQAADILKRHNEWRRSDADIDPIAPKLIGEAIDVAIAALQASAEAQPSNLTMWGYSDEDEYMGDTLDEYVKARGLVIGDSFDVTEQWSCDRSFEIVGGGPTKENPKAEFIFKALDVAAATQASHPQPSAPVAQAKEHAVQQAQQWAQEAHTQRSIVIAILRGLGLPENDWEAERLVLDHVASLKAERHVLTDQEIAGLAVLHGELTTSEHGKKIVSFSADSLLEFARALLSTAPQVEAKEGWKLVPIEPTKEMLEIAIEDEGTTIVDGPAYARQLYKEMIAAAPSSQKEGEQPK